MRLICDKVNARIESRETITSGSQGVFNVSFEFNEDWVGLSKTATFKNGEITVSVLVNNSCVIPWEVLTEPGMLYIGVYGILNDEIVIPTVWCYLGRVLEGTILGDNAREPTPSVYQELIALEREAVEIAQSVRDDADAGKFNGKNYVLTSGDKYEIANTVRNDYFNDVEAALNDLHLYAESLKGGDSV